MKLLWLVGGGVLLLVIALELVFPEQEPSVPSYTRTEAAGEDKLALLSEADRTIDFSPMDQYQSIKDRPLFFEGRRPPAEYSAETPQAKPEKPAARVPPPRANLSAVIRVGDQSYAMLGGVRKSKGLVRVKVGEDVDGWKVASIQDDRISLKNGVEKHDIPLRSYKAVPLPKAKANGKKPAAGNNKAAAAVKSKSAARKKALAARRAAREKADK